MEQYCEPCVVDFPSIVVNAKTIEGIFNKCLEYFGVSEEYVKMKNRKRERVLIRQMCMYAIKLNTRKSLEDIGYFFNGKDHTTVIHAINTVNDLCDTDESVKREFESLKSFVTN